MTKVHFPNCSAPELGRRWKPQFPALSNLRFSVSHIFGCAVAGCRTHLGKWFGTQGPQLSEAMMLPRTRDPSYATRAVPPSGSCRVLDKPTW